jgi:hypothetical protein
MPAGTKPVARICTSGRRPCPRLPWQGEWMRPSVAAVARLVTGIVPYEEQEAEDITAALRWLDRTV